MFISDKKRLKTNDLEERSFLSKLLPNFLRLEEKKGIKDIKVDE